MMNRKILDRLFHGSARLAVAIGAGSVIAVGAVVAQPFGTWSTPVSAEIGSDPALNTASNDGCPILSPDGLSLYMASNRPGGLGGQDIWVARRATTDSGWDAPINLAAVNSNVDDFCPSPVRGRGLFFVSRRHEVNGDIYFTQQRPDGSYEPAVRLGPNINSPLEEWSPSFFYDEQERPVLYFSRNTPGTNTHDIYYSVEYGPAQLAPGLEGPLSEARPNVRKDGREIVFDSNRQGLDGQDVWTSTRASTSEPWGTPVHLVDVSSPGNDTRASLSWDGTFLMVGSNRAGSEGMADIYVSHRAGPGNAQ
ncbi:MAG TPA: hypothetical protein VFO69_00040 [Allosphingosinicella sp.]|nr:hypothetical protein [Allosphingosinicella sp.]